MKRANVKGLTLPRELNTRQLEALKGRVVEEMDKGTLGMSTGLEYTPGWFSTHQPCTSDMWAWPYPSRSRWLLSSLAVSMGGPGLRGAGHSLPGSSWAWACF